MPPPAAFLYCAPRLLPGMVKDKLVTRVPIINKQKTQVDAGQYVLTKSGQSRFQSIYQYKPENRPCGLEFLPSRFSAAYDKSFFNLIEKECSEDQLFYLVCSNQRVPRVFLTVLSRLKINVTEWTESGLLHLVDVSKKQNESPEQMKRYLDLCLDHDGRLNKAVLTPLLDYGQSFLQLTDLARAKYLEYERELIARPDDESFMEGLRRRLGGRCCRVIKRGPNIGQLCFKPVRDKGLCHYHFGRVYLHLLNRKKNKW